MFSLRNIPAHPWIRRLLILLAIALLTPTVRADLPVPPPMPKRAIARPDPEPPGHRIDIIDGDYRFILYIPPEYRLPESGRVNLTVHFHTVPWFIIDEHLRRGLTEPLLMGALGEGSSTYARPFTEDPDRFARLLEQTGREISRACGEGRPAHIAGIDITSFSAGYGAVRELVKQERYWKQFRRIILCDSLYAGWDPSTTQPGATSRPSPANIEPWRAYVESAARGERTFVLTHSLVPTPYANTDACGQALIEMAGAVVRDVPRGQYPATLDADYPLIRRADRGRFHVWTYAGEDAGAHTTHVRHLAEVWRALDEADRVVTPAIIDDDRDDETMPPATQPGEIRRGMRMGDAPAERYRRYWDAQARRIEPDLRSDPARIEVYLDFFRREIIRDPRLFAMNVRAAEPGDRRLAHGAVEFREQAEALRHLLGALGLDPGEVELRTMPTDAVGDRPFAIVRRDGAFLRGKPSGDSEKVNEALAGEPAWLLDQTGDWVLCHSSDGYVGWIRADEIERTDADRFTSIINADPPRHADPIEAVIAEAHRRLGRPYIWGGRSDDGVDCSGLVQRAFASQGIHLPRDAEQQALVGRLVATRWHRDGLRRGDLLFFLGRRGFISHTGIYLGDGKMIESADGGVRVSDFAEGSSLGQRFCFAKRVLD